MDISENSESQQPHPQQGDQNQFMQQQQMQCDPPMFFHTNGTDDIPFGNDSLPVPLQFPMQTAIPLPPPPGVQPPFEIPKNELPITTSTTDVDIDSLLLQKFSCLGTTDHEDLVTQFRNLMNNQIDKEKAIFFLEMSNWNLQTAVGCYLDFCNSQTQTLPSMKIVHQSRPNETQQVWRLQNDGSEYWPNGCYLMSPSQTRRIEVPVIKPGETCDIVAEIPPSHPAIVWHLCSPDGSYFGEPIWMSPPDTCSTQAELAEKMSQLIVSPNSTNPESFPQVNIVISVNME